MKKKNGKVLVLGAGISGIRSALDLAETGYRVTLIDQSARLGGVLSRLDYQFPTNHCGMCRMLPLVERDSGSQYCLRKGLFHENIDIMLETELVSIEGEPGRFSVVLRQKPAMVDPALCLGCGLCLEVCPVEVADEFNYGLNRRKAIYLPAPQAIPNPFVIDDAACTRCGECVKVCPTKAISLIEEERKAFRLLVVDDELIVRDSLKEWLELMGFSADVAPGGAEALDLLASGTYHLMLLDIKMPGMDGVEVLTKARELRPDLDVIMMTAYATVDTAVEAMKIGALDYLIKPFDPETLRPMILNIFEKLQKSRGVAFEFGALVLCGGTDYFDPKTGSNNYGYGIFPGVVTSLEFERLISQTGPGQGVLVRPQDNGPVTRIAWLQCVGSRDVHVRAPYCSSVCCMFAIKEAMLAREKVKGLSQSAVFYMDMRTFGQEFQRYRDQAREMGVRFERGRIHTVDRDLQSGDLKLHYMDQEGSPQTESFDLVVLSVGQRPAARTARLAETLGLELNDHGFVAATPFAPAKTNQDGIVMGGSFSGLKDIGDSVILAGSAALAASRVLHSSGGSLALEPDPDEKSRDVSREPAGVMVLICGCGRALTDLVDRDRLADRLTADPAVSGLAFIDLACTKNGWDRIAEILDKENFNRLLIGACLPYGYGKNTGQLAKLTGLDPALIEVVDIRSLLFPGPGEKRAGQLAAGEMEAGLARVKRASPLAGTFVPVVQKALVVGGGIAGMTAALALADHGFSVDLVEREEKLGGNLNWLHHTLEGRPTGPVLEAVLARVAKHPLIETHLQTRVMGSYGQVGRFFTTIEDQNKTVSTIEHGVTILATGGTEAPDSTQVHGQSPAIVTQKELEEKLTDKTIDPQSLKNVIMIQCVGSREEPRNYCSRICCPSALKHALELKKLNPGLSIYILYRDIMTPGFSEEYYTRAREAGIFFIPFRLPQKPEVRTKGQKVLVSVFDLILGRTVEMEADLVVLATGVKPDISQDLAGAFGAELDQDGFVKTADSKWRPVDTLTEGVFACGLVNSPRNIEESIATAEAAAQRALRILNSRALTGAIKTAVVRHNLCSLCERCLDACPYGARTLDLDLEKILVNAAMCQGCGSCAAVCPNSASVLTGQSDQQYFEVIDAALQAMLG